MTSESPRPATPMVFRSRGGNAFAPVGRCGHIFIHTDGIGSTGRFPARLAKSDSGRMQITLKRYRTLEDLICPYFQIRRKEIAAGTVRGHDSEGNTTEFSIRDIVEVIRNTGIWGYTDDVGCIHYWHGDATFQSVLEFFAHEIAHHTGTPRKDRTEEELRADEYAKVAVQAYDFALLVQEPHYDRSISS